jgi:hypothetical protein
MADHAREKALSDPQFAPLRDGDPPREVQQLIARLVEELFDDGSPSGSAEYRMLSKASVRSALLTAAGREIGPIVERLRFENAQVRYKIDGHDETLAFSTQQDAAKFWEFVRRVYVLDQSRRAITAAGSSREEAPEPTEQPVDRSGDGRFLLNSYGRSCFDLGYEAAVRRHGLAAAGSSAPPQEKVNDGGKRNGVVCSGQAGVSPDPPALGFASLELGAWLLVAALLVPVLFVALGALNRERQYSVWFDGIGYRVIDKLVPLGLIVLSGIGLARRFKDVVDGAWWRFLWRGGPCLIGLWLGVALFYGGWLWLVR